MTVGKRVVDLAGEKRWEALVHGGCPSSASGLSPITQRGSSRQKPLDHGGKARYARTQFNDASTECIGGLVAAHGVDRRRSACILVVALTTTRDLSSARRFALVVRRSDKILLASALTAWILCSSLPTSISSWRILERPSINFA